MKMFPDNIKVGMVFTLNNTSDKSSWNINFEDRINKPYSVKRINASGTYNIVLEETDTPYHGTWDVSKDFLEEHFNYIPEKITNWKDMI